MCGVFVTFDVVLQNSVVASALAFEPQAAACDPYQRVEPVNDSERLSDHLHNPVSSTNVGQFVTQHDPGSIFRPFA